MRLLIIAALCATGSSASADGFYVTEAFGGSKVGDELGEYTGGGMRMRLSLGARLSQRWAVEGWIAAMVPMDDYNGAPHPGLTTVGLDVKYLNPIATNVDLYLRGTISRGKIFGGTFDDYSGRGLGAGAGVQLKGKVRALGFLFWPLFFTGVGPKVTAALFVDSGYEFYRLHRPGDEPAQRRLGSIDAQVTNMTLGFAVGSDF